MVDARTSTRLSSSPARHCLGDEPDTDGLRGRDRLPGQVQLESLLGPDRPVDDRHDDHRPQADVHLGGPELDVVSRHDEVTGARKPEPAGEGVPVQSPDDRLAESGEGLEQQRRTTLLGRPLAPRLAVADPAQIAAGTEHLFASPSEHHDPDAGVGLGRLERGRELARAIWGLRALRTSGRCSSTRATRACTS